MNKTLIGLLVAICLVIGLIPAMAMAEGENLATQYSFKLGYGTYYLTKYDTPVYFVNGAVTDLTDTAGNSFTYYMPTTTGASESNWNAKMIWHSGDEGPTLYLDGFAYDLFNEATELWRVKAEGSTAGVDDAAITPGADYPCTIVLQGDDSVIKTRFGVVFSNDLTVKSEGDTKLTIYNASAGLRGAAAGAELTLDANVDVFVQSYYTTGFNPISVNGADVVVNGGNINLSGGASKVYPILVQNSGNLIVNGGNLSAKGGYYGVILPAGGSAQSNGGSLEIYGGYSAMTVGGTATVPVVPAGADITFAYEAWGTGTNATTTSAITITKAAYMKVTHNTPAPTETTAPATETTAPVQTTAPAAESTAPVNTSAPTNTTAPANTSAPTETTAPTAPVELTTQVSVRVAYSNYKITKYDTPVYSKNYSIDAKDTEGNAFTAWAQTATGADESNYNMKFVWHYGDEAPTLYLRGFKYVGRNVATGKLIGKVVEGEYTSTGVEAYPLTMPTGVGMNIVITGEDSLIAGQFGLTFKGDTTITSEGNAKLVMNNGAACITSAGVAGKLTINANLDLRKSGYYNTAFGAAVIQTYKSDLIINGGTIVATTTADKSVAGIAARAGGNLIINGGDITAHGIAGQSPTNGSLQATAGKVIINGGKVKVTAKEAVPVYGLSGIEINGGEVNITSPYYGMNSKDGDVVINGGKVTIISANGAFYGKAPVLGAGVDGMAGNSESDADYYDETKYKAKWLQLTYTAPGGNTTAPSNPGGTTTTPSTPSGTTAPSTPGATNPTTPSNPGNNPATGDSGVTMFVVMLLVGMFGIVATVAFGKKRAV